VLRGPRRHLTRYHGVFAPHSELRAAVTPALRRYAQDRRGHRAARGHREDPLAPRAHGAAAAANDLPAVRLEGSTADEAARPDARTQRLDGIVRTWDAATGLGV
jgi:hypothetical protein